MLDLPPMKHRNQHSSGLDLAAIGAHLQTAQGPEYWRSLEELADSQAFQEFVQPEIPQRALGGRAPLSGRHFLQLMGASLALAGLGACSRQPEEKIVPY